jgi:hypothetical protein
VPKKTDDLEPGFQPDDLEPGFQPPAFSPILTPVLKRGMGHRPGPMPAAVQSTRQLFGAVRPGAAVSGQADLSGFVFSIRDQAQTSRCVGAANARIINIGAQQMQYKAPNATVPYPSERGLYSLAREEESPPGVALVDQGSIPAMLVQAVSKDIGIPLEKDFPEDDAQINQRVPPDVLAKALSCKVSAVHTIDSAAEQRVADCCQALLEGFAFSMAIAVGANYEGCNSDAPVVAETGSIYGGHDVAIVGFRKLSNGRTIFRNPGSWGTTFGVGGWVWLDESVITDPRTSNLIVITAVPTGA